MGNGSPCKRPEDLSHPVVQTIRNRVESSANIKLTNYGLCVTLLWRSTPMGFKFTCSQTDTLARALRFSPRFALATAFFDVRPDAVIFREVSQPDSLHFRLPKDPAAECSVHLDSVSIVEGRDAAGQVIYASDLEVLERHLRIDKQHRR
jgi:hypothetical protein